MNVTAIVLAAGQSTRMGRSKPRLPFGQRSVVHQILSVLAECALAETVVVTGHEHEPLERHLAGWGVRLVHNPDFASGEMLSSLQAGLRTCRGDAALVVLGDQPALERDVVDAVLAAYERGLGSVIIPSYQMRRGHPVLIDRRHWGALLALPEGQTMRGFFQAAAAAIYHVATDAASVLRDMDTPADYERELADFLNRHQVR